MERLCARAAAGMTGLALALLLLASVPARSEEKTCQSLRAEQKELLPAADLLRKVGRITNELWELTGSGQDVALSLEEVCKNGAKRLRNRAFQLEFQTEGRTPEEEKLVLFEKDVLAEGAYPYDVPKTRGPLAIACDDWRTAMKAGMADSDDARRAGKPAPDPEYKNFHLRRMAEQRLSIFVKALKKMRLDANGKLARLKWLKEQIEEECSPGWFGFLEEANQILEKGRKPAPSCPLPVK